MFWRRRLLLLVALTVVVLGATGASAWMDGLGDGDVALDAGAVTDGAALTAAGVEALEVRATVTPPERAAEARVRLDGTDVTDRAQVDGGTVVLRPGTLPEGEHRVEVAIDRRFPMGDATASLAFTVDTAPPPVELAATVESAPLDQPVSFTGSTEPGASVTADGAEVAVGEDGAFTIELAAPPIGALQVVAADAAGNTATAEARVKVELPETRSVHISTYGWASAQLREPVLDLLDRGIINAVQLDLKDESGILGYDSQVPLARETGAAKAIWDLEEAVAEIHRRGGRVIGRVVAFRDPVLANWAWDNDRRDMVIQTSSGAMLGKYGGFTNFADDEVRQYNIAIAVEGAEAGVDDILYDYIRRPEGDVDSMRFPGIEGTPEDEIVSFLAESQGPVRAERAIIGASVFGIAVHSPTQIAQDIPRMAAEADYIAPMVYPSLWNRGEFDVAHPEAQPYDIVYESMLAFLEAVAGTDAKIVPWLQDFSLALTYGPAEVAAQIRAAADAGIDEWIMWDPKVTYTVAGLPGGS